MEILVSTIVEITGGRVIGYGRQNVVTGVVIDSRQAVPGSLFVAFAGQHADGHNFLADSHRRGAVAALVERTVDCPAGMTVIRVESTLSALQDLAAYWRRTLPDLQVVGITGSCGKTTTKEFVAAVLAQKYTVCKSAGNQNNEIGLPLSILTLAPKHRYAVLEMGMSARGEIAQLASISQPGIGVFTNIGDSHIEYLGSREGILAAKLELAENISPPALLVLNGDDPLLRRGGEGFRDRAKLVFYGLGPDNDITATGVQSTAWGSTFSACWGEKRVEISLNLPGKHNVLNALAAVAVGLESGVAPQQIAVGLARVRGEKGRVQVVLAGGVTLIDDSYNASPDSTRAALEVLAAVPCRRRVAFLGDMLELGPHSHRLHTEMGRLAAAQRLDLLVAVGEFAGAVRDGAVAAGMTAEKILTYPDSLQASEAVALLEKGDGVLVKGSRGVKMDTLVDQITDGGKDK